MNETFSCLQNRKNPTYICVLIYLHLFCSKSWNQHEQNETKNKLKLKCWENRRFGLGTEPSPPRSAQWCDTIISCRRTSNNCVIFHERRSKWNSCWVIIVDFYTTANSSQERKSSFWLVWIVVDVVTTKPFNIDQRRQLKSDFNCQRLFESFQWNTRRNLIITVAKYEIK